MTIEQLTKALATIPAFHGKNKIVYNAFRVSDDAKAKNPPPPLPYLQIFEDRSETFAADGIAYFATLVVVLRLYTALKSQLLEQAVELKLTENDIYFTKNCDYLENDQAFLAEYWMSL